MPGLNFKLSTLTFISKRKINLLANQSTILKECTPIVQQIVQKTLPLAKGEMNVFKSGD